MLAPNQLALIRQLETVLGVVAAIVRGSIREGRVALQCEIAALDGVWAAVTPKPRVTTRVGGTVNEVVPVIVVTVYSAASRRTWVGKRQAAKFPKIHGHVQAHPIIQTDPIQIIRLLRF